MDRPHLRTVLVTDLIQWDQAEELVLSPKFQRRRVWPPKAKSYLIDTILHGFPVPKLYMRQHINLQSGGQASKTIREIVDGQQRVASVLDYFKGKFKISRAHEHWARLGYSDLEEVDKKRFMSYEFSVDVLIGASDADVLNVFARINSHSIPLNAQEKRNAKYYGEFKQVAYGLGWQHLEFWKQRGVLSDQSIARMREAELTSELIVGMLQGLQDKKKSLDTYYSQWDEAFPKKSQAVSRFKDTIDLLEGLVGETLKATRFSRPALFYSLFLAVYDLKWGINGPPVDPKAVAISRAQDVQAAIKKLSGVIASENPPKKYGRFVTACQRQTDNIEPRRIRHRTIIEELKTT